jgi:hypothetical protein
MFLTIGCIAALHSNHRPPMEDEKNITIGYHCRITCEHFADAEFTSEKITIGFTALLLPRNASDLAFFLQRTKSVSIKFLLIYQYLRQFGWQSNDWQSNK